MISTLEKEITFRFLKTRKKDGFLNVISIFSFIGISLGVAVLIIVMSVMNGFRANLTERLVGVNSHLNIYSFNKKINLDDINTLKINLDSNDYDKFLPSIETILIKLLKSIESLRSLLLVLTVETALWT